MRLVTHHLVQPTGRPLAGRFIYAVPTRLCARASHVPVGRTLHVLDVENLAGADHRNPRVIASALCAYRGAIQVESADHVEIAAHPRLLFAANAAWPGARLLAGEGADGADLALIATLKDVDQIAARYDRVIFGSGDAIFTFVASSLAERGIVVGVVARRRSVARRLRTVAHFTIELPEPSASHPEAA